MLHNRIPCNKPYTTRGRRERRTAARERPSQRAGCPLLASAEEKRVGSYRPKLARLAGSGCAFSLPLRASPPTPACFTPTEGAARRRCSTACPRSRLAAASRGTSVDSVGPGSQAALYGLGLFKPLCARKLRRPARPLAGWCRSERVGPGCTPLLVALPGASDELRCARERYHHQRSQPRTVLLPPVRTVHLPPPLRSRNIL